MTVRGKTVEVKCRTCGLPFMARVADRKRGWGRYCSKSCKAIKQTQETGYGRPSAKAEERPMSLAEMACGGYGDSGPDSHLFSGKWD